MVYIEKPKLPRTEFHGELRAIKAKEDAVVAVQRGAKALQGFKYLDISVLDKTQNDPKTGEPGLWHNVRISAPKDQPIVIDDYPVLSRCNTLVEAKTYPMVKGRFYVSVTEKRDPVTKKVVVENGKVVEYHNKKMSLADLGVLEIVEEPAPSA